MNATRQLILTSVLETLLVVLLALPAVGQKIPPSHYLKVYWLAEDETVNFMVVDDEHDHEVYECEIRGRTMHSCTVPPRTYVVTDFSRAAIPQQPAKARTVYFVAEGDIWDGTSVRDLTLKESVVHALHNPFGREDR